MNKSCPALRKGEKLPTKIALLISRQPERACLKHKWVEKTVEAIKSFQRQDVIVLSSVGMKTWELVTAICSIEKIPLQIYLANSSNPETQMQDWVLQQFDLDHTLVEFVNVRKAFDPGRSDEARQLRDELVVDSADLLVPISIRPNGRLSKLIELSENKVDRTFETDYLSRGEPLAYRINETKLNKGLRSLGGKYLFHWTRGVSGCWPGERKIDLYRSILSFPHWKRNAIDTLVEILDSKRIISSSRHMPESVSTVSFSSLSPEFVAPLMRWRSRYGEMSFEPYAIGIDRKTCNELGVVPVHYFHDEPDSSIPLWRQQSVGKVGDWKKEEEYRHLGNFSLNNIEPARQVLICRFASEAEALSRKFGLRAIAYTSE